MKKKSFCYHLFLFLSTFARGLVELFSLVFLYKKGFEMKELFFFLFIMYLFGVVVNYVSLKLNYKLVLVLSSVLFGGSFLFLSFMKNTYVDLILFAGMLASSNCSFHVMKHYMAGCLLDVKERKANVIICVTYLGSIISSIVGIFMIDKLPFIVTGIVITIGSFFSFIPVLRLKIDKNEKDVLSIFNVKVKKKKVLFNIFEQFKVIFLEIQPLFLYLYVEKSISYVGIFNVIVNIASLVLVYFLSKRINKRYFKYFCIGLGLIFILKLNIKSGIFLFGLAFFEGIFVKLYENISLGLLYDFGDNDLKSYLLVEELIFFSTKCLFMLIVCLLKLDIYVVLYICIIGIIISGFFFDNYN